MSSDIFYWLGSRWGVIFFLSEFRKLSPWHWGITPFFFFISSIPPLLDISAHFLGSDICIFWFFPHHLLRLHPLPPSRHSSSLSFSLPPPPLLSPCSCSPKCEVMIVAMATKTSSQSGFVLIRPSLSLSLSLSLLLPPLVSLLFLATLPCQHGLNVMIINEIIAILHLIITAVIYRTWRYHHLFPSDITTTTTAAAAAACCCCCLGQWCQVHSRWI